MNMAEILRKLADVVDQQGAEMQDEPGAATSQVQTGEPVEVNVKPMVPPLQQKLDIMKKLAGIETGEEEGCTECGCDPCECDDGEDEMSIMKRNAGIAPVTITLADEDEPWEG
jgi:hypothetical protein